MSISLAKAGFTFVFAVYGIMCADADRGHFIDGANLVVHEAGHCSSDIWGRQWCPRGTILQLLVPVAFTVYFVRQGSRYSAAVTLFWAGQNMFNISVYIKDAPSWSFRSWVSAAASAFTTGTSCS